MKTLAVLTATLLLAVAMSASGSQRATTLETPDSTFYIYAFPHGLEIWEETNGVGAECGTIHEGMPIGHVTEPEAAFTGLQRTAGTCGGLAYDADTKIA